MQITLSQFEQIDGIRCAMLRSEGLPDEARLEGRLFTALVDTFGFAAIKDVPSVGEYADELICDCLTGKRDILDDEPCGHCTEEPALHDGLCRDCWEVVNGQFGVGA